MGFLMMAGVDRYYLICLTISLPVTLWMGHNTDLPSESNISKKIRVNIPFAQTFFKEYSISFLMVCRLIDFAHVTLTLLVFKVCVIVGIPKIEVFDFCGTERVKQNQKSLKIAQNLLNL